MNDNKRVYIDLLSKRVYAVTHLDLEERSFLCIYGYYLGYAIRFALIRLIVHPQRNVIWFVCWPER